MKNRFFALAAVLITILAVAGCNQAQTPSTVVTPEIVDKPVNVSMEIIEPKNKIQETQVSIEIADPKVAVESPKTMKGLKVYTNTALGISFQYPEKVKVYGKDGAKEEVEVKIIENGNVIVIDNGLTGKEYFDGVAKNKDPENPSTFAMIIRDIKNDTDLKKMAEKFTNDGKCVYTGTSAIPQKPGFFTLNATSSGKIDPETGLETCSTGGMATFLYDPVKGKAVYWLIGGDTVLLNDDVGGDDVVFDSFKFL